jgi:hypothetical protein
VKASDVTPSDPAPAPRLSAAAWVGLATLAGSLLLLATALSSGEWRGAIVTEVQIAVVGLATWLVVRSE